MKGGRRKGWQERKGAARNFGFLSMLEAVLSILMSCKLNGLMLFLNHSYYEAQQTSMKQRRPCTIFCFAFIHYA